MMRPFLKWAGGKYNILPTLNNVLPKGTRLIEPFVGSGAVFLNTNYKKYLLADNNLDLINLFNILKEDGNDFIKYCARYFQARTNNEKIFYDYRVQFNKSSDIKKRSALFLYLNRHGYNGLCRYNASGKFNVPFGEYKNPELPKERMHYFIAQAKKATFLHQDFITTMKQAKQGDVIYCDPPYVPLSDTARFTAYSPLRFSLEHQELLATTARTIAAKGIPIVISNHDLPQTRELYKGADIISLEVQRTISSKIDKRFPVKELIAVFS